MRSTSEVGHAKNVANFNTIIQAITAFGATYNPSNANLAIANLQTIYTDADAALALLSTKNAELSKAINDRFLVFQPLKPLATKVINALKATGAKPKTVEDAVGYNRKIQGSRSGKLNEEITEAEREENPEKETTNVSVSQQSYDYMVQHLANLIEVLKTESNYAPNETELQVATLETLKTNMETNNTNVVTKRLEAANQRIERNKILYTNEVNLVELSRQVKQYVKSLFGPSSEQYKQISGLKFVDKN